MLVFFVSVSAHNTTTIQVFFSMRYRQLALIGFFIGLSALLTGCGGNSYYDDLPDWDFSGSSAPAAQQEPAQIASATVPQQPAPADPYEKISYKDFTVQNQQGQAQPLPTQQPAIQQTVRVGILLPLSGPQASLGKAMLQSAQMALFDVGHSAFELMPYDTQGTGEGARAAASHAINDNVQLILGPVFANSVRAAKNVVRYHNVNMISFSTDWSVTSSNVFIMGFLPFDQIDRIITYAADHDLKRIAAIAPRTTYGRAIISAYQAMAEQMGIETVDILTYDPQSTNLAPELRTFTHYDERNEEAKILAETIQNQDGASTGKPRNPAKIKQEIDRIKAEMEPPYDAVLIAAGGKSAVTISNLLSHFDLPHAKLSAWASACLMIYPLAMNLLCVMLGSPHHRRKHAPSLRNATNPCISQPHHDWRA